jgi:hypothetical protein
MPYGVRMVQQPRIPSPALSDTGKGRFMKGRHVTVLERFDGTTWLEIGRFGSEQAAGSALDAAVAAGSDPETLRITDVGPTKTGRVAFVVGVVLAVAIAAFVVYVLFAG